jgi:NADP-dependent 3-hydroxy acid dehydrogenase YdfG
MEIKTFVVAGASGAVGEGIVAELLEKGHKVIAIVRNKAKEDLLKSFLSENEVQTQSLICINNTFDNEQEINQLTKQLLNYDIDVAIASLGGWYQGKKLYEVPNQDLEQVIQGGLLSHLYFAKVVLPIFEQQNKGDYVMINGGASEFVVPHSGIISIVAAAQKMMTQVLFQEFKNKGVRIHAVAAFDLVKTRQRPDSHNLWLSPKEITHYIVELIQTRHTPNYWHKLQQPEDMNHFD